MTYEQIGIWGSYHYGNFGDDLMAELFARYVRECGFDPVVFSTNPAIVSPGVARVLPSLDLWPEGRCVVIGGGAMLSSDRWVEYLLRPATRAVDREFKNLLNHCRSRPMRLIPVSIGGGGTSDARILGSRKTLFQGPWAPRGTVRLKGDLTLMQTRFNKQYYEYFPDVLFSTAEWFGISRKTSLSESFRIGVNLHAKRAQPVLDALVTLEREGAQIIPITTHSAVFPLPYEWGHGTAGAINYESISPFLAALSSLEVIVSDKLHVGLVAATLGVPFLSYQAKPKTVALHRELNAIGAIVNSGEVLAHQLRQLMQGERVYTLAESMSTHGLSEQARGHFKFLRRELERSA